MYTLGILNEIGKAIMDGLRTLMLTLCDVIYKMIYLTFNIFEKLGTAQIIEDSQVQEIFNRVGLIIGIFMLFRLTFSFIQYIVDPDAMFDKKKGAGNIIAKIIIAIVLLGSTSTIFKFAFTLQERIVDSHIISKIIFGSQKEIDNFGGELSANVFTAFYRLNDEANLKDDEDCKEYFKLSNEADKDETTTVIAEQIANTQGSLTMAYSCITERDEDDKEYVVSFDGGGFIALVAGVFVLYTIMIFTIQVGVRVLQLAYLQIIAPIPIMMYITPKGDEQLKKWGQQCLTTFLDFFIRVAIIYFAVFIIKSIWQTGTIGNILTAGTESASGWETAYVGVIMIIAVLTFAKKVPNLIKEVFPSLGGAAAFDYGLSFKKQVVEPLKSAYNSPLGWGLKLGKNGVVSAIGAIDRKKYGLPKPRTKLQEKIDKLTPGRAEAIKNERAGAVARMERDQLYREGEEYYNMFPDHEIKDENGKLRAGVFQNSAYAESWQKVADAKAKNKKYEAKLVDAQAKVTRGEITVESEEYKSAVGNAKAANGRLEAAKQDHENIRKIYTKDARREDAYNYYHDMQFDVPSNVTPQTNNNNNSQSSDVYRRVNEVTGISRPSASENGAPTADNSLLGELASQVEQEQLQRDFQNNLRNENNANNNTSNSHDNRQYSNGDDVGE